VTNCLIHVSETWQVKVVQASPDEYGDMHVEKGPDDIHLLSTQTILIEDCSAMEAFKLTEGMPIA